MSKESENSLFDSLWVHFSLAVARRYEFSDSSDMRHVFVFIRKIPPFEGLRFRFVRKASVLK